MNFISLLKQGRTVTIKGTRGELANYTPSTFFYKDGGVWVKNEEIGTFKHPKSEKELTRHFTKMIKDGFCIVID